MENWYKKAITQEQLGFPFDKDISSSPQNQTEYKKWMQNTSPKDINSLYEILQESTSLEELLALLQKFGNEFIWKKIDFANGPVITLRQRGKQNNPYIIDDPEDPELKDAREWLDSMFDSDVDKYIPEDPEEDFNKMFWDQANGVLLYHATQTENEELIKKHGLFPKDESRGINNRSTPAAVFASNNPDDIGSYGDVIFEINIGQMKADGYMPEVSMEEPLAEAEQKKKLAYMIGVEEYYPDEQYASEGLYPSTVIIYGKIPPKYLRKI